MSSDLQLLRAYGALTHIHAPLIQDFVTQEEVDKILDAWESKEGRLAKKGNDPKGDCFSSEQAHASSGPTITAGGPPLGTQIAVMMSRHGKLVYKDPVLYIGRALIYLISNFYFSLVYVKVPSYHPIC